MLVQTGMALGKGDIIIPFEPPKRVVSINLCTDQLAMMLATPEQLFSVSYISLDPRSSPLVEQAKKYTINYGLAEEIFLMQPDLVLTGEYSLRQTADILRRLGIRVITIPHTNSLRDVRRNINLMGQILHRQDVATEMIAAFDRELEKIKMNNDEKPTVAIYAANGYTAGNNGLVGDIIRASGLHNIAADVGFPYGGMMPLEILAMAQPDMIVTSKPYKNPSRAETIMDHPVLHILRRDTMNTIMQDQDWMCGTPYVINAIKGLNKMKHHYLIETE